MVWVMMSFSITHLFNLYPKTQNSNTNNTNTNLERKSDSTYLGFDLEEKTQIGILYDPE